MKNDKEERLIESIVTIATLIFFGLLIGYILAEETEGEGLLGDLNKVTASVPVSPTKDSATQAVKVVDENTSLHLATNSLGQENSSIEPSVASTEIDMNLSDVDEELVVTFENEKKDVPEAIVNAVPVLSVDSNKSVKNNVTDKSEADEEAGIIADIKSNTISTTPYILKGVSFKSGSSILTAKSKCQLDVIAKTLMEHKEVKINLRGHSDRKGSMLSNEELSKERAASVGFALVDRGVDINSIMIQGIGEREPLTKDGSALEMSKNRRVDIAVTN